MVPRWILLSLQYMRTGKKEFLNLASVLTLHIDLQNLKIPIIGSKIKVVECGQCDQNLCKKDAKPMEKDLAQSDLPVRRKFPKTTQKCNFYEKWHFRVVQVYPAQFTINMYW